LRGSGLPVPLNGFRPISLISVLIRLSIFLSVFYQNRRSSHASHASHASSARTSFTQLVPVQFPFTAFVSLKLANGLNQSSSVFGTSKKVCSFFKGLIVSHRHHDNCAFTLTSNSNWGMIIAHLFHGFSQVAAR
jgi:hypothetical protein